MRSDSLFAHPDSSRASIAPRTERLIYEPARLYSLATYSASERASTSIGRLASPDAAALREINARVGDGSFPVVEQKRAKSDQVFPGGAE